MNALEISSLSEVPVSHILTVALLVRGTIVTCVAAVKFMTWSPDGGNAVTGDEVVGGFVLGLVSASIGVICIMGNTSAPVVSGIKVQGRIIVSVS